MAKTAHRRARPDCSTALLDLLAVAVGMILQEASVATDPRKLKPGELCRVLNSSDLGDVISTTRLAKHRQSAGLRIGDGKTVDLFRYAAWLFLQRRLPAAADVSQETPDDRKAEAYERHKERVGAREREKSAEGRDIGEIPAVVDPARKERCRTSLRFFYEEYLPERYKLAWSDDHLKVISKIETAVLHGGLFAMAMPRGSGKTTMIEGAVLWAILYGYRKFVALIGADLEGAQEMLESLKVELETNERLLADFPELVYPIVCLEGIAHRCRGQTYRGERTRIGWQAQLLIMPTIPGAAGSGAIIKVKGITGRIRGMKHARSDGEQARPDLAVVDDGQTDESAHSDTQVKRRRNTVTGAILGLAGPGKKIAGFMPCTVIRRGDMADQILDHKKYPEWQGERMRLVYSWPTNEEYWNQYKELWANEVAAGRGIRACTQFYAKHRKVMDEGGRVGWPQRFNSDEISAIQHAVNLQLREPDIFDAEYQNDPPDEASDPDLLTAEQISRKVNGYTRRVIPRECTHLTGFIDVHGEVLYWLVAAWSDGFTGYVVDYGTWPDQQQRHFTLRGAYHTLARKYKGTGPEGRIFNGLMDLTDQLCTRNWDRDDGGTMALEKLVHDRGFSNKIVDTVLQQSPHRAVLLATHGRGVKAKHKPMHTWSTAPGERVGLHWRIRPKTKDDPMRYGLFDTNFWKSFVHARFTIQLGDHGSLSLWGRNGTSKIAPNEHLLLAEHCRAEHRTLVEAEGRKIYEWEINPGDPDNHFFDCLVGATVAASMVGCSLPEHKQNKKPRRGGVRYLNF